MRITFRTFSCCVAALLLLMACGSSPQVRFFALSPTVPAAGEDSGDAVVLGLGPLRLPEYLNRSQIVTRGAGAEMRIDEFNRWAEPLNLAVHRTLAADIDSLLDGVVVIAFPYEELVRTQVEFRLLGDILRFDSDSEGRVVLQTQWAISSVAAEVLVPVQRKRYEARAGAAGDPAAIAAAMNQALGEFGRGVADMLQAALQE